MPEYFSSAEPSFDRQKHRILMSVALLLGVVGLYCIVTLSEFPVAWFYLSVLFAAESYVLSPVLNDILRSSSSDSREVLRVGDIGFDLKRLNDEFSVFERVPLPSEDAPIDYVVWGPTGVFAIWVKSLGGYVEFDGVYLLNNNQPFAERSILDRTSDRALKLRALLTDMLREPIPVMPVLVFSNPAILHFGSKPFQGVFIIRRRDLLPVILGQNEVGNCDLRRSEERR